jgi:hypothetical protein
VWPSKNEIISVKKIDKAGKEIPAIKMVLKRHVSQSSCSSFHSNIGNVSFFMMNGIDTKKAIPMMKLATLIPKIVHSNEVMVKRVMIDIKTHVSRPPKSMSAIVIKINPSVGSA